MGLILVFLIIVAVMSFTAYCVNDQEKMLWAILWAIIPTAISGVFSLVVIFTSYGSYVDLRTSYDATVAQYRQAVTVYVDHAQINVEKAALTDFKYEGYQDNVADFVTNLRRKVVWYNEGIISKRIMDKNWFIGWFIIAPDKDMKVLNMIE